MMNARRTWRALSIRALIAATALWAVGCSDSIEGDPDAAPVDGGSDDAGPVLPSDGGPPEDASSSMDAGPTDAGPEPCPTEGETRTAPCGNCGTGQEMCTDGVWTATGVCLSQGECSAGSVEMETTELCGERARICDDACEWLPWDVLTEDGECLPGTERTSACTEPGETRPETCSDSCEWVAGACESVCVDLRTGPADAEVCVPEGPFVRGDAEDGPTATIHLSTFAIDQHPVTVARYRACVTAGDCPRPRWEDHGAMSGGNREWYETAADDQVALVAHPYAQAFCEWDGGRRLPTDAEWQKAVRGPAPRTDRTLFGATWDCAAYPVDGCPGPAAVCEAGTIGSVSLQSHYGLRDVAMVGQWVNDEYRADYYSTPASQADDPQGPPIRMSNDFVVHGVCGLPARTGVRGVQDHGDHGFGFRCARTITGGM